MLVSHRIDHENKVIITTLAPEEVDLTLFLEAFTKYNEELRYLPDFQEYHELVDFRPITRINISPGELKEFSNFAVNKDEQHAFTRLALLVDSKPAFTLAKIYEMIRNFNPASRKQVKVFREMETAMAWLVEGGQDLKDRPA